MHIYTGCTFTVQIKYSINKMGHSAFCIDFKLECMESRWLCKCAQHRASGMTLYMCCLTNQNG